MKEDLIPVQRDGAYLEVHPSALKAHEVTGWKVCEKRSGGDDASLAEAAAAQEVAAAEKAAKAKK